MNRILKMAAASVFALALGFGARSASAAAVVIEPGTTATVDGWQIAPQYGVALTVNVVGSSLVLEKTANFPGLNSVQVTFNQVGTGAPTSIEFENESITNSGTATWSGFQFLLLTPALGPTSPLASFAGTANVFVPPSGTGYDYTSFNLNAAKNTLTYSGTQSPASISDWGSSAPGDDLLINTNGATNFTFDEVPVGAVIPLPAAAWQGLVGLLSLGAIGLARKIKLA